MMVVSMYDGCEGNDGSGVMVVLFRSDDNNHNDQSMSMYQ